MAKFSKINKRGVLNKVGEGGKNGIIIRRGVSSIRNSRAHDIFFSWTFDLLLVSCSWYLVLGVLKEIFLTTLKKYWKPKLHHAQTSWERNQPRNKNKHFNLFLILILKKPVFQCKVKTPYEFLFFLVSWTHFQKQLFADILQNWCS